MYLAFTTLASLLKVNKKVDFNHENFEGLGFDNTSYVSFASNNDNGFENLAFMC